tara:strand:- start:1150 stop:1341 length:192 start_codon:yes stop_codon:yes gene_type:complete
MTDQDELPRHFVATLRYSTDNYRTVYFCSDVDPLLAEKDAQIRELERRIDGLLDDALWGLHGE